jgi:hypothetical protein
MIVVDNRRFHWTAAMRFLDFAATQDRRPWRLDASVYDSGRDSISQFGGVRKDSYQRWTKQVMDLTELSERDFKAAAPVFFADFVHSINVL